MLAGSNKLHVVVIAAITALLAVDVGSQRTCTTLRNEIGSCVPALSCFSIIVLLECVPSPLPPSISEFIRNLHCGTFDNVPFVCCNQDRVISNTNTEIPVPATTNVPITSSSTRATPIISTAIRTDLNPLIRSNDEGSDVDVQSGMAILEATDCGECGEDRVANGIDANLSEYPWMALLVYNNGTLNCGGTLITDQYVLTAAHCIKTGENMTLVRVRLGEHNLNETIDCVGIGRTRKCAPPVQEIDVKEAIYHKEFAHSRYSLVNDVGLIRLAKKALLGNSVRPICLPVPRLLRPGDLSTVILAGWGRNANNNKATILQKAAIPVRDNSFCQSVFKQFQFTDDHMCAGAENDIDACKGDSGGPIFYYGFYQGTVRWVQFGVVSAGSTLCGSKYPGIYMRLTSYVRWIAGNIKP